MEVLNFNNMSQVQSSQVSPTSQNGTPQILYALSTVALLVFVVLVYIIQRKSQENEDLAESYEILAENLRSDRNMSVETARKK